MPILIAQPAAEDPATSHIVVGKRRGEMSMIGTAAPPPEVLLPSGDTDHRGDDAGLTWAGVTFQRRVERIRRQLAPLRTQAALVASYGREAGHRGVDGRARGVRPPSPLQVAYALRWLELARPTPVAATWADLLDGPLE
ncbi:MAG: hypothetical protein ABIQ58_01955 [Candidatus Limnocylindrales bacterium]